MTEGSQQHLLDLFCENLTVSCRCAEDYISARNVGLNLAKPGVGESSRQRLHFDQFITADINTAQKGHVFVVSGHQRILVRASGNEPRVLAGRWRGCFTAAKRVANDGGEIFNHLAPVASKT